MIEVITPGFYTTVQDLGRVGYHDYGVPYSGVMDVQSSKIANALLGNEENDAVLEITMTGPKLKFKTNTRISITGADISPQLNGKPIVLNKSIDIIADDVLSFGRLKYGFRAYLAVYRGFQTEMVMCSRSMYKNITTTSAIEKGDELSVLSLDKHTKSANTTLKIKKNHFETTTLQVYKGPEFSNLSKAQQKQLFTETFTVSKNNNRMGYQLENIIQNNLKPIITSLVQPGTIQLPPSGQLIVLMRDGQTAGGYPRVLQLTENSINKLSQKRTGYTFTFQLKE